MNPHRSLNSNHDDETQRNAAAGSCWLHVLWCSVWRCGASSLVGYERMILMRTQQTAPAGRVLEPFNLVDDDVTAEEQEEVPDDSVSQQRKIFTWTFNIGICQGLESDLHWTGLHLLECGSSLMTSFSFYYYFVTFQKGKSSYKRVCIAGNNHAAVLMWTLSKWRPQKEASDVFRRCSGATFIVFCCRIRSEEVTDG